MDKWNLWPSGNPVNKIYHLETINVFTKFHPFQYGANSRPTDRCCHPKSHTREKETKSERGANGLTFLYCDVFSVSFSLAAVVRRIRVRGTSTPSPYYMSLYSGRETEVEERDAKEGGERQTEGE